MWESKVRKQTNDRLPATIQVDVDGLEVLLKHHGHTTGRERDFIFLSALPRFLELFGRWRVKCTFFIIGKDLEDGEKVRQLRNLVEQGHEVGNHTMNHPVSLSEFNPVEQEEEIAGNERICWEKLGIRPVGFRAPNFDADERTLHILRERGYLYDSSVLAMPYAPLLRWCKERISSAGHGKTRYLGRAVYGFAPLRPYQPAERAMWKRGRSEMAEVPITTMPFLRLPFHASFNLALRSLGGGNALFNIGYACARRTRTPLNYVFHACELADNPGDERLQRHWGLGLPLEERLEMVDSLIQKITQNYDVMPTREFVKRVKGEG